MYMGIAMTTSSQACTVPALHWDIGVVLASSTCWRRSSWSSDPSDRLRLRRVGLERLSESGGVGGHVGDVKAQVMVNNTTGRHQNFLITRLAHDCFVTSL